MVILERSLIQTLKALNLPYSENEILKIKEDLKNELQLFKQRELLTSAFALIIDGYSEVKLRTILKANMLLVMPASVSTQER